MTTHGFSPEENASVRRGRGTFGSISCPFSIDRGLEHGRCRVADGDTAGADLEHREAAADRAVGVHPEETGDAGEARRIGEAGQAVIAARLRPPDRKSTRLNSSHVEISYA